MSVHRNAALTLVERRQMVAMISGGSTLTVAAVTSDVGANTVRRWWPRYLQLGLGGLEDRSSRPARSPRAFVRMCGIALWRSGARSAQSGRSRRNWVCPGPVPPGSCELPGCLD